MTKLSSIMLSAILIALPVSAMAAYEAVMSETAVPSPGTVKFKGTAPAPKTGCQLRQRSVRQITQRWIRL